MINVQKLPSQVRNFKHFFKVHDRPSFPPVQIKSKFPFITFRIQLAPVVLVSLFGGHMKAVYVG